MVMHKSDPNIYMVGWHFTIQAVSGYNYYCHFIDLRRHIDPKVSLNCMHHQNFVIEGLVGF